MFTSRELVLAAMFLRVFQPAKYLSRAARYNVYIHLYTFFLQKFTHLYIFSYILNSYIEIFYFCKYIYLQLDTGIYIYIYLYTFRYISIFYSSNRYS